MKTSRRQWSAVCFPLVIGTILLYLIWAWFNYRSDRVEVHDWPTNLSIITELSDSTLLRFRLPLEIFHGKPKWNRVGSPPLSKEDAIDAANLVVNELKESGFVPKTFQPTYVEPTKFARNDFYWIVRFENPDDISERFIDIVVLMDGSVPKPLIERENTSE